MKDANPFKGRPLAGLLVLVADDDEDQRYLLRHLLEFHDAEVITASSAADALRTLADRFPDVIISDLEMPGGDGFGLLRSVREGDKANLRFVPAIALTSNTDEASQRRARESGFFRFLVKPADPELLCSAVAQLGHAYKRFTKEPDAL